MSHHQLFSTFDFVYFSSIILIQWFIFQSSLLSFKKDEYDVSKVQCNYFIFFYINYHVTNHIVITIYAFNI